MPFLTCPASAHTFLCSVMLSYFLLFSLSITCHQAEKWTFVLPKLANGTSSLPFRVAFSFILSLFCLSVLLPKDTIPLSRQSLTDLSLSFWTFKLDFVKYSDCVPLGCRLQLLWCETRLRNLLKRLSCMSYFFSTSCHTEWNQIRLVITYLLCMTSFVFLYLLTPTGVCLLLASMFVLLEKYGLSLDC